MIRNIKYPTGYSDRLGYTKIAVSFQTETFKKLLNQAKKEKRTFSEMAELAVQTGLYDLQESDKLEPRRSKVYGPKA
jgi:hypothetical protein